MSTEKSAAPAYTSPKSLKTFFDQRREDSHIPLVVDRSLLRNFSGSTANELIASLKFLGLINAAGKPQQSFAEYARADDEQRKALMAKYLRDKYAFLFDDPEFDLERATSNMVAERFRAQGISGSTLARAISFFLAVAKDSGIKVSSNVNAPAKPASSGNGSRAKKERADGQLPSGHGTPPAPPPPPPQDEPGTMKFEIPVPNKPSVKVIIPESFDAEDWELLNTVFAAYIKRWKGYATNKDKGPTP